MKRHIILALVGVLCPIATAFLGLVWAQQKMPGQVNIQPAHISHDRAIKYDYDIVYVRSPRWNESKREKRPALWAEFGHPFAVNPGSDLMLLHPDGTEELLVPGGDGAIQDPYVAFDGEWVFYTRFHVATNDMNPSGADIYKVHVKTRQVVRLTDQKFTTNKEGVKLPYGVYNMHPCPLPGGRVAFVSNRNGFLPPPKSYPPVVLQLHIMDEDGSNIETIGHLNLGGALHPVILKDGRIIFSSLENMGLRRSILWGLWSIWQDGTVWNPVVSGFFQASGVHFQTQLSDERIVWELYYNQNQKGFGTLFAQPPQPPPGHAAFGSADLKDPRNPVFRYITGQGFQMPFTPYGTTLLTPWATGDDNPALPSIAGDPTSPRIGKVTHPSGAPDNHLLLVWSLGPMGGTGGSAHALQPQPIDSGIYLLKNGQPINAPGEMRLIKNDPNYNEQWPRALVPYGRIYGVAAPAVLRYKNDGSASAYLPEGTPFGLVGTSSLYKRESAPLGAVPPSGVTAVTTDWRAGAQQWHWENQGSDAGRYDNGEIQAIRILAFEPNAARNIRAHPVKHWHYPLYSSHAMERLRILGEIPVRMGKGTAVDPDGNPDTSFLAKIPADVAFTFQMIDKNGMALNMAQTWHQVRPGENRHDCGGCHAHSQKPTLFEQTAAARPDYALFDLTQQTPLVTAPAKEASGKRRDTTTDVGLRFEKGSKAVEYWQDIRPILDRSCTACHTKQWSQPAGGLVLDDDDTIIDGLPGTYVRLAEDEQARFSPKPVDGPDKDGKVSVRGLPFGMASHYIWKFQSRRSLLIWKIYGKRLDGWINEDIPGEELSRQDPRRQALRAPRRGEILPDQRLYLGDVDYTGSVMPPPTAVEGTYQGPNGKPIKVAPLTDEDRRTIVRWIDLGCPIDLAPNAKLNAAQTAHDTGMSDDQRPTLTLTYPAPGVNPRLSRILIGMHDYNAGLDMSSFQVIADVAVDGIPSGRNLASQFHALPDSRWEWRLASPITHLARGKLIVSIKDQQGNLSRIERTFSVN